MKKRLTESQFKSAVRDLEVGEQTLEIARGVLVRGMPQAHFVTSLGLTKGAVSQAVARVWTAWEKRPVAGFETVTATLPTHRANIVRAWEKEARAHLSQSNTDKPPGTTEAEK